MVWRFPKHISVAFALVGLLTICAIWTLFTRNAKFFSPLSGTPNHTYLRQIGASVIVPYSYPVALSPDGAMLLTKTKTESNFELSVYKQDHLLAKIISKYSPWELSWDPSGRCIAYLAETDVPGTFSLNLWWPDSNKTSRLSVPITKSAGFPVRWSPDGHRLAFVEYDATPDKSVLSGQIVILSLHENLPVVEETIPKVNPLCGFAWSADSKQLVFSSKQNVTSIDIYSIANKSVHTLVSLGFVELKDISWAPSSQFIVGAIRKPRDQFYRLVQISLDRTVTYYPLEDGDDTSPVWSDGVLYYVQQKEAHDSLCVFKEHFASKIIKSLSAGLIRIQNDGYKHLVLPIVVSDAFQPPALFVVNNHSIAPVTMGSKNIPLKTVSVKHLWLPGDGHSVPAWLWNSSSSDKAIVIMHGGIRTNENGNWEPLRQAFACSGFTVLAPNFSGSTGYGVDFENTNDVDTQCRDLIASVHYLEGTCGIKKNHVLVLAYSNGTKVLFEALRRDPSLCGMIVIAPTVVKNNQPVAPIEYQGVILAFHGSRDPVFTPETAHSYLEQLFRVNSKEKLLYWRVFADEAHDFSRVASLQEIYGTVWSTIKTNATSRAIH